MKRLTGSPRDFRFLVPAPAVEIPVRVLETEWRNGVCELRERSVPVRAGRGMRFGQGFPLTDVAVMCRPSGRAIAVIFDQPTPPEVKPAQRMGELQGKNRWAAQVTLSLQEGGISVSAVYQLMPSKGVIRLRTLAETAPKVPLEDMAAVVCLLTSSSSQEISIQPDAGRVRTFRRQASDWVILHDPDVYFVSPPVRQLYRGSCGWPKVSTSELPQASLPSVTMRNGVPRIPGGPDSLTWTKRS